MIILGLCFCSNTCGRVNDCSALDLSNRLEIKPRLPPKERSNLPLVYELELPEISNRKEAIPFSAMRPGETFPDVDLSAIHDVRFDAAIKGVLDDTLSLTQAEAFLFSEEGSTLLQ